MHAKFKQTFQEIRLLDILVLSHLNIIPYKNNSKLGKYFKASLVIKYGGV